MTTNGGTRNRQAGQQVEALRVRLRSGDRGESSRRLPFDGGARGGQSPPIHSLRERGEKMRRRFLAFTALAALAAASTAFAATAGNDKGAKDLAKINHIVVIYEENHSFDNLYSGWEGVNGLQNASAANWTQRDQNGAAYSCLLQ